MTELTDPADQGFAFIEGPEDVDWIKTLHWDLPETLPELMPVLTGSTELQAQKDALSHAMTLPSWQAAPTMLQTAAARFLAGNASIG